MAKTIRISNQIASLLSGHVDSSQPETESSYVASNDESFAKILSQFNFNGPVQVATRILSSIDEEGLSEHHRLEEDQAAESTSEEVTDEADAEAIDTMPSRLTISTSLDHITKSPSITHVDEDIWITRKE